MTRPIQLIVGLGNPGPEYANTRHNVGAWLVSELAAQYSASLKPEKKFSGLCATFSLANNKCHLLLPQTFMNLSGQSVRALVKYYKIPLNAILIAHDDLDFPAGHMRLKYGGGAGGHRGLQNIIQCLGSSDFWRLRIGIGHPGNKDLVHDYVLNNPKKSEKEQIMQGFGEVISVVPDLLTGDFAKAQQALHIVR